MEDQTITTDELDISPVIGVTLEESSKTNGGNLSIQVTPFAWPSIGTEFQRVVITSGDTTKSYFIKSFTEEKGVSIARAAGSISLAEREHTYLSAYRNEGCPVPRSKVMADKRLAMEDCGTITLESKLRDETPEQQEKILSGIAKQHARFIVAGRSIFPKLPAEMKKIAKMLGNMRDTAEDMHKYWRPGASEEERERFMKAFLPAIDYIPDREKQLIPGDTTTYHILIDEQGNPRWVDLERGRLGHPTRSSAGYLFSPEVKLGLDATERVLKIERQEVSTLNEEQLRDDAWISYLKAAYVCGILECTKRATAVKRFELQVDPEKYAEFITQAPGFNQAHRAYSTHLNRIISRIKENGLYDTREKTNLANAGEASLELISS